MKVWANTLSCVFGVLLTAVSAYSQTEPGLSPPSPAGDSTGIRADQPASVVASDTLSLVPVEPIPLILTSGGERSVSHRTILDWASVSLGDGLLATSGAYVLKQGWHGMPQYLSLRGGRANEVIYLLDGVAICDNQIEVPDLSHLPLAGVQKTEIIKGGLSSIYGAGAITGAFEITSLTAMPEIPESEVTAWWGSHDGQFVSVRFNRKITERLGVLGTYGNLGMGGWMDNTSSEAERFFGKAVLLPGGGTQIELAGYNYKGDYEWPDSCPGSFSTSSADRRHDRDLLKLSLLRGERRRFRIDFFRLGALESFSSAETSYVHDSIVNGVEAGVTLQAPDSALTAFKVGCKNRKMESSSLGDRTSSDLYACGVKEIRGDRWRIQGSIRVAKNSDFDAQAGLGLTARYLFKPGVSLFSRLDRSYRFPGFDILYAQAGSGQADCGIGAETSNGIETGVAVCTDLWSFSVSLFGRGVGGLARIRTDDSCRAYLDQDIDVDALGSEASLEFRLPPWLKGHLFYCYCKTEYESGVKAPYLPEQVAALTVELSRGLSEHVSVGVMFGGWYVSPLEVGARFEPCEAYPACLRGADLPGYTSSLISAYMDIDRAKIFIKAYNIADDDVKTCWGRPGLPSRSYEFGASAVLVN